MCCVCVYVCVWEGERYRDRQTDRHTAKYADAHGGQKMASDLEPEQHVVMSSLVREPNWCPLQEQQMPLTFEPSILHSFLFNHRKGCCYFSSPLKRHGCHSFTSPAAFWGMKSSAFLPWPHPSPIQLPWAVLKLSSLSSQPCWFGGRAFSWPAWLGPLHNLCLYKWVCPASTFNWPIKPSREQGIPTPRPIRRQRHPVLSRLLASECQAHLLLHRQPLRQKPMRTRDPPYPLLDNNKEAMAWSQRAVYTSLCQMPKKWL